MKEARDTEAGSAAKDAPPESILLLRRYQSGDQEALNELLDRYRGRVERIVRARLGRWLRARVDIEDVVQEVLLHASLDLEDFEIREDAGLINWMAKVAENEIKRLAEYHGAQKRDLRMEHGLDQSQGPKIAQMRDLDKGPATQAENREEEDLLLECLDSLEELDRELILLRVFAGASYEFLAERLGLPGANASTKAFFRARTKLAKELAARTGPTKSP